MNRKRYAAWIGSLCFLTILLIAGPWFAKSHVERILTIHELAQEREQFETSRPLKSVDHKERFAEYDARCRSYASTSIWANKSIVVQGFWVAPFEGLSMSAKPSGSASASDGLLMKPAPGFHDNKFSIAKFIPDILLPELIGVVDGDCVRIFGVYHAIGYREHDGLLKYCSWLEFNKIERWNHQRARWEMVDYWY